MASGRADRRRAPGQLEAEVLTALWAADGPLTASEVQAELGGELAGTTVLTILARLHAKGIVEREREGRSFRYTPVADQPGLAARRMRAVLDSEDNRDAALAHFVSDLDAHDEQILRDLLRRGSRRRR